MNHRTQWALNSAVECHLHTVEVIGSNPIAPTIFSTSYGPLSDHLPIFNSLRTRGPSADSDSEDRFQHSAKLQSIPRRETEPIVLAD